MSISTYEVGNEVIHLHRLEPSLQLDLTSPVYQLKEGQASKVVGLDVITPNSIKPVNRRRSLRLSLPEEDRPVTTVEPLSLHSLTSARYTGVLNSTFATNGAVSQTSQAQYRTRWEFDTYTSATGRLTDAAAAGNVFTAYNPLRGDRIAMHAPIGMRGVHDVLSKVDANSLTLPAGLISGASVGQGTTDSPLDGFIASRPGYVFLYPYDNVILNPTFASSGQWELSGNWAIGSGNLTHTVGGGPHTAIQRGILKVGSVYKFKVKGGAGTNNVTVKCGTSAAVSLVANTDYYATVRCIGNGDLTLTTSTAGITINSIYGVEVTASEVWFVKTPDQYDLDGGGWPADMAGADIVFNPDRRMDEQVTYRVLRVDSWAQENDTLVLNDRGNRFSVNNSNDRTAYENPVLTTPAVGSKFEIHYSRQGNVDGILLSNGRKFWIEREGRLDLVMDLGDDSYKGYRWRAAKIASNRILLVSPRFAPRVLHVDSPTLSESQISGEEVLAGMPAPFKHNGEEFTQETDTTRKRFEPSWLFEDTTTGTLTGGNYQVLVRLVHIEDAVTSDFVPAAGGTGLVIPTVPNGDPANILNAASANTRISVFASCRSGSESKGTSAPVISKRATHIEIWGSLSSAQENSSVTGYFLQQRILIADLEYGNERSANIATPTVFLPCTVAPNPPDNFPITLKDADITSLPSLSVNEFLAGGLPPICQDVVSLLDITLCFGKADAEVVQPTLYSRDFHSGLLSTGYPGGVISAGVATLTAAFTNYEFRPGDMLHVTYSSSLASTVGGGQIDSDDYEIAEKLSADAIQLKDDSLGVAATEHSHWYIKRPYTVTYPRILSDEDVWYSRTDIFGPENFPPRVYTLSRRGDVYRKAVVVGQQAVVIMDQAVHLLRLENVFNVLTPVSVEVGVKGMGTPWADSVVQLGNTIFWATPLGIRSFTLSEEANIDGNKYKSEFLGGHRFQSWFTEAWKNRENIDAGADPFNLCLRFRRNKGNNQYETLQYSLRTEGVTIIQDDNGLRYVSSHTAEVESSPSPLLYSVEENTGAITQVNTDEIVLGDSGNDTDTTLTFDLDTIRSSTNRWNDSFVGEVIKLDGQRSVILAAEDRKLTFAPLGFVPTSYVVAPRTFAFKPAPMRGRLATLAKTLHSAMLRALPSDSPSGPDITVKVYESLSPDPSSEASVPCYFEKDSSHTSRDRVALVTGEGSSLEVEVSVAEDFEGSFEIEHMEVEIREENTRR